MVFYSSQAKQEDNNSSSLISCRADVILFSPPMWEIKHLLLGIYLRGRNIVLNENLGIAGLSATGHNDTE